MMTKHFDPNAVDYDVGYGKPPVATRFQPGQSGNPRGRPRRAEASCAMEALRQSLQEPFQVKTGNGKTQEMTLTDVMAHNIRKAFAGGKVDDQIKIMRLLHQIGYFMFDERVQELDRENQANNEARLQLQQMDRLLQEFEFLDEDPRRDVTLLSDEALAFRASELMDEIERRRQAADTAAAVGDGSISEAGGNEQADQNDRTAPSEAEWDAVFPPGADPLNQSIEAIRHNEDLERQRREREQRRTNPDQRHE